MWKDNYHLLTACTSGTEPRDGKKPKVVGWFIKSLSKAALGKEHPSCPRHLQINMMYEG